MLRRLAKVSGIATPTAEGLIRLDRNRHGGVLGRASTHLVRLITTVDTLVGSLVVATDTEAARLVVSFEPDLQD